MPPDRPVVGVLGGTFDPVHRGHVAIALRVAETLALQRVLLLPCATPPHKSPRRVTRADHRLAMLRLALAAHRTLELCTLETDSGRVCYTIDTLRRLRAGPPPLVPVFILGSDSLGELPTWREHRALVGEFDLIAVDRPDAADAAGELAPEIARALVDLGAGASARDAWGRADAGRGGRIFRVSVPPVPVSSSRVRALVAAGRPVDDLVAPAVARYILDKGLYAKEESR